MNELPADDFESNDFIKIEGLDFGPGNRKAIGQVCEAIGQIIETWGFKKILGMTWAFLYLCPEPASAKDIGDNLGISAALVSMTLQDLLHWQVVKKISPPGKRRDYYIAEHDIWKMIRKVFREREKNQMELVQNKLGNALVFVDQEMKAKLDLKGKRTCQFQKIRIEELSQVTQISVALLETFIDKGNIDIGPLFSFLKPLNQLANLPKAH